MSAFIVAKETINRIVTAIVAPPLAFTDMPNQCLQEFTKAYLQDGGDNTAIPSKRISRCYGTEVDEWGTWLGRILWSMNVEAVSQRYPTVNPVAGFVVEQLQLKEASEYEWTEPSLHWVNTDFAEIVTGDIDCLLYQCAEGDVHKSHTYQALEWVQGVLAIAELQKIIEVNTK